MNQHQPWPEERIETLKKLWADGLSAGQISERFGDVSRSAVIGKVHRLNLPGRAVADRKPKSYKPRQAPPPQPRPTPKPRILSVKPATPVIRFVPEPPVDGRVTLMHLSDQTCKWPIGDVGAPDFCFCGAGPHPDSPYCEYHARIAYQPAAERKRSVA
jgi:GcrA cell cycle regulator